MALPALRRGPTGGEMSFDRSWYNRDGRPVFGFCTDEVQP
jgi:polyphosphate kinase 2 (PPK2 family)